MTLLDRLAARLGYTRRPTNTITLDESLATARAETERRNALYDVALAMEDNEGHMAASIPCVMKLKDFEFLTRCWYTARATKHPTALVIPIQRNGVVAYMGLLVQNVRALSAVPVAPIVTAEGEV